MKTILFPEKESWDKLCKRPEIDRTVIVNVVREIINSVKSESDIAVYNVY